jgi:hypothetical protein
LQRRRSLQEAVLWLAGLCEHALASGLDGGAIKRHLSLDTTLAIEVPRLLLTVKSWQPPRIIFLWSTALPGERSILATNQ